jgi:hypothetical protein
MKHSIFVKMEGGGSRAIALQSTEDEMIQEIEEKGMQLEKLVATRFLAFLGNRRISLEELRALPIEEQNRLKKEFRGD